MLDLWQACADAGVCHPRPPGAFLPLAFVCSLRSQAESEGQKGIDQAWQLECAKKSALIAASAQCRYLDVVLMSL